ncbi:Bgt-1786 [Blumeria graminis f. sp. tritici]|uniref:Uncharacterized protein n=3 Tax=Blumeria graminis f. sp. tritici TaxID=62690 RepID=A0A656KNL8_BLUGR|nr:hypothetical protein BGT96224_1786 [Blumeria graminis f. sp. tritici 96224]VCU41237.1 Bgt-1786 [Blumeria graminis f. sp. tritici]
MSGRTQNLDPPQNNQLLQEDGASFLKISSKTWGSTSQAELANVSSPPQKKWDLEHDYERLTINKLLPGPKPVSFHGIIVNFSTRHGSSTKHPRAKGWHYLIIKDAHAVISIKLYFADSQYCFVLGQSLTTWTTFISKPSRSDLQPQTTMSISANIFPDRVTSDHLRIYPLGPSGAECNGVPADQCDQKLFSLISLDNFIRLSHDCFLDAKILVLVKSIGNSKQIHRRDGGGVQKLVDVILMDQTAEYRLTLWNDLSTSAVLWHAGQTILLITNPGFRAANSQAAEAKRGNIEVNRYTMIEIDPLVEEAVHLRQWARFKAQCDALTWNSAAELFDLSLAETTLKQQQLTMSELSHLINRIRVDMRMTVTGLLSVTLMRMELQSLHLKNKLICGNCSYSNSMTASCNSCGKLIALEPNARIVGLMLDETGCIHGGSLLWSPQAWEALLGQPVSRVTGWNVEACRLFEQRMCFRRIGLCVVWLGLVGDKLDKTARKVFVLHVRV